MSKIPVEYSSNNSGGDWWLKDNDWKKLEKAGWKVFGHDDTEFNAQGDYKVGRDGLPIRKNAKPTEFLGSYGKYAYKKFENIQEALVEFEKLTGQDVSSEGCNCCGAPHTFTWGRDIIKRLPKSRLHEQDYNYASGEDLLQYLYPDAPTNLSKRELLAKSETLNKESQ